MPAQRDDPGTGFTLPADEGRRFAVKVGDCAAPTVSSGWFRAIRLPRLDGRASGGNVYSDNIESCGGLPSRLRGPDDGLPGQHRSVADEAYWATQGCYARGDRQHGRARRARESAALTRGIPERRMSAGSRTIVGSTFSPADQESTRRSDRRHGHRQYLSQDPNGSNGVVRLVNIYGFFIEGMGDVDEPTAR